MSKTILQATHNEVKKFYEVVIKTLKLEIGTFTIAEFRTHVDLPKNLYDAKVLFTTQATI